MGSSSDVKVCKPAFPLPSRGLWYDHHNTAITRLTLRESGSVVVGYMNMAEHLSDDLLS